MDSLLPARMASGTEVGYPWMYWVRVVRFAYAKPHIADTFVVLKGSCHLGLQFIIRDGYKDLPVEHIQRRFFLARISRVIRISSVEDDTASQR